MKSSVFILLVSRLYSKLSGVFLSVGFEGTVIMTTAGTLSAVLSERRSTCRAATEAKLQWMREVEEHATFTLNTNYLEDYRARFEETYRMLRHERATSHSNAIHMLLHPDEFKDSEPEMPPSRRSMTPTPTADEWPWQAKSEAESIPCVDHCYAPQISSRDTERNKRNALLRALEEFGLPSSIKNVLKLLPSDSADEAIEIMADVRAYWQGELAAQWRAIFQTSYHFILYYQLHSSVLRITVPLPSIWIMFEDLGRN